MSEISAVSACGILGLLALFQIALACGAPFGNLAWGGESRVLPANLRGGSIASVFIYVVIAAISLERAEVTHLVGSVNATYLAVGAVIGYFVLGILMNTISWHMQERFTITAVTIIHTVIAIVVVLG